MNRFNSIKRHFDLIVVTLMWDIFGIVFVATVYGRRVIAPCIVFEAAGFLIALTLATRVDLRYLGVHSTSLSTSTSTSTSTSNDADPEDFDRDCEYADVETDW